MKKKDFIERVENALGEKVLRTPITVNNIGLVIFHTKRGRCLGYDNVRRAIIDVETWNNVRCDHSFKEAYEKAFVVDC